MRILCYILVVLFVTTSAVGQQINPVPDYIFRNSMSVGRNAPTDTSAYFSIGPRFGATRGFMPPMVVDTAAVTGTKRNGLLIYSIQRNSFLYWDSTGSRWSRIAANLDTLQLATRAWRQKGDDSLAARINTRTDTLLIATRAWRQKGDDSLAAIINTRTDTLLLSTRAWRQKGIDSVASVRIGGSGTANFVSKFTATRTVGNSLIQDDGSTIGFNRAPVASVGYSFLSNNSHLAQLSTSNAFGAFMGMDRNYGPANSFVFGHYGSTSGGGTSIDTFATFFRNRAGIAFSSTFGDNIRLYVNANGRTLVNTVTDAGFQFDVNGTARTGTLTVNTNGQGRTIRTDQASGTTGLNIFIGGAGGTLTGTSGNQSSQNVTLGVSAGNSITTGFSAVAIGYQASNALTTASNTVAIGTNALQNNNGSTNIAIGTNALQTNVSGIQNTAVGISALANATTSNNSAFGSSALNALTSGSNNDAFGLSTLASVTTGSANVAVGQTALFGVITASNNTAIGTNAGRFINVGTQNNNPVGSVFIGRDTRAADTAQSNQIVIGHEARGNGSNTVTIGNSSITQNYFTGEMLVGYTSDQGAFSLQANGNALINGNIRTAAPAGGTANDWRLGTVATVSPTSPNRTIEVSIGGTIYYIHAKTTND